MSAETSSALPRLADFGHALPIQTRWNDNDVYGHINNVVYYAYFDTVINRWLIGEGGLDPASSDVIGLCVESQCRYLAPAAYPDDLVAGLRVTKLGRSSVRYEVGIFRSASLGTEPDTHDPQTRDPQTRDPETRGPETRHTEELLAFGYFVHVFVDRAGRRPTSIPDKLRTALERLLVPT